MLAAGVRNVEPVGVQVDVADIGVPYVDDPGAVSDVRTSPPRSEIVTVSG